jgi:hypothetical protein
LSPLASLPAFQTSVCPVLPQLQHVSVCGVVAVSLSLPMALLPFRHHSTATWPSVVRPMQHWCLCWRCSGVLARMLLASLQTLRCCCCWRCAGIVALAARTSWPLSCWRHQYRCTRVAASITNWRPLVTMQLQPIGVHDVIAFLFVIACCPLLYMESSTATEPLANAVLASLPVLRWHLCPRRAGIIEALSCHCCWCCTGVTSWESSPSLHWHCRLCCPCIAASIANWHLPNQNAAVICPHAWCQCCGHLLCLWPCRCP